MGIPILCHCLAKVLIWRYFFLRICYHMPSSLNNFHIHLDNRSIFIFLDLGPQNPLGLWHTYCLPVYQVVFFLILSFILKKVVSGSIHFFFHPMWYSIKGKHVKRDTSQRRIDQSDSSSHHYHFPLLGSQFIPYFSFSGIPVWIFQYFHVNRHS